MIDVNVPGFKHLQLEHLVMDYNGTLAVDGTLKDGVSEALHEVSQKMTLHIITADTFGQVRATFANEPYIVTVLQQEDQAVGKLKYIEELGTNRCVCMGNGRNDRYMLEQAALGIAVMLEEGTAKETILAADILMPGILPAFQLLANPLRMTASLRS
jgi:soluble P-type ATPase